jgi:transposase
MEASGLAPGKKNAARLGAHIVFADEAGFLLIPSVRKTWSPRGETPIVHHRYRRDKISAISGVSVSPRRRRLGLYCLLFDHNIQQAEVCVFVRHLLRHLRGHVILLWDGGPSHGGEPIRALQQRFPRLHLERFPGYAPELNPDEVVWAMTKSDLANGRPDDLEELMQHLMRSLAKVRRSQSSLRRCIHESDLPSFLV